MARRRGRYFYAGRSDDVVKRDGVRISLNEIAHALRRVEASPGRVRAHRRRQQFGHRAYVEAPPGLAPDELLSAVSAYLPHRCCRIRFSSCPHCR